jgi:hypothetical protein
MIERAGLIPPLQGRAESAAKAAEPGWGLGLPDPTPSGASRQPPLPLQGEDQGAHPA